MQELGELSCFVRRISFGCFGLFQTWASKRELLRRAPLGCSVPALEAKPSGKLRWNKCSEAGLFFPAGRRLLGILYLCQAEVGPKDFVLNMIPCYAVRH